MEVSQSVRAYVDAWNRGDLDAMVATFAPDGTYSDPGTPEPVPAHAFKEHMTGFCAGFPDVTFETVSLHAITEGSAVWRWVMRGTNTGSYRGLPPTGHTLALPGCDFIEVNADKIQRIDGYFDRLTMLVQLGLAPSQPTGAAT